MEILDRLEKRFGRYAIPGLIHHVILFNAGAFLLTFVGNDGGASVRQWMVLDRNLVMQGEIWRLVTHLFVPLTTSAIWIFFSLYFLWLFGNSLEREWGAFRFNCFYFLGALGTTIGGLCFAGPAPMGAWYLNTTLLMAFATLFPDFTLMLFFVVPLKIRWLGWFAAFGLFQQFMSGPPAQKLLVALAGANYLLFFGAEFRSKIWAGQRRETSRRKVAAGKSNAFHCCGVCGRTEHDGSELEFRVCSLCDEPRDYCLDHLDHADHG